MNDCELFQQGIRYCKAVRQADGQAENGLINFPAKQFIGLPTGEIFDCREPEIIVGEEITPQDALALIEQRRQYSYREVDRQLTAIKKASMLY